MTAYVLEILRYMIGKTAALIIRACPHDTLAYCRVMYPQVTFHSEKKPLTQIFRSVSHYPQGGSGGTQNGHLPSKNPQKFYPAPSAPALGGTLRGGGGFGRQPVNLKKKTSH